MQILDLVILASRPPPPPPLPLLNDLHAENLVSGPVGSERGREEGEREGGSLCSGFSPLRGRFTPWNTTRADGVPPPFSFQLLTISERARVRRR